jgi:hypothetical protein
MGFGPRRPSTIPAPKHTAPGEREFDRGNSAAESLWEGIMKNASIEGRSRAAVAWSLIAVLAACDTPVLEPVVAPQGEPGRGLQFENCVPSEAGQDIWACIDLDEDGVWAEGVLALSIFWDELSFEYLDAVPADPSTELVALAPGEATILLRTADPYGWTTDRLAVSFRALGEAPGHFVFVYVDDDLGIEFKSLNEDPDTGVGTLSGPHVFLRR